VTGDCHAGIRGSPGVRFPRATRPLAGLLSLCRPAFTQPSFQTFCMLLVGFTGRVRDCTVTGMLQAAGLAGVWLPDRCAARDRARG